MAKHRSHLLLFTLALFWPTSARAQQIPAAIEMDPSPDREFPATMEAPDIMSHGSGRFSFSKAIEDTRISVQFSRDAENVKKYRIDPKKIVLVGHSMGGFMVAYGALQTIRMSQVS